MKRLILFFIRRKLHVKKHDLFRFTNQKSKTDYYFFTDDRLMKYATIGNYVRESNVRLNWLLNDNCKVLKLKEWEEQYGTVLQS